VLISGTGVAATKSTAPNAPFADLLGFLGVSSSTGSGSVSSSASR